MTVLIIPPETAGASPARLRETPYGAVPVLADGVLVRDEGVEARAVIYAAKDMGARRVLAADHIQAVSPLLEPGDLVVPSDVIDQTRLRPHTFFVNKGYGFTQLAPPFCPDLMEAALVAARQKTPRSFRGAVYICTDGPREATPAELRMYRHWGADVMGTGLLPEAYLARELELCYAAITAVGSVDLLPLLRAAADVPRQKGCACNQTMKHLKQQGMIGEDWRTW